ncbi:MAG: hypothetical protein KJN84_06890 [Bacteroidia bacterium]|nr:hypothetical protein [Bacteroidia bacterium]
MEATTIDDVLTHLDAIIATSKNELSTIGYFAAMYRTVTQTVKNNLGTDFFQNDDRMEKLDVIFANRYLKAYSDYNQGKDVTASWKYSFEESKNNRLIVLQHLMLGMNTHINLDLGVAAAQISTPENIEDLKIDFNKINEILGGLVERMERDLSEITPFLNTIIKLFKNFDKKLINFSMTIARNGAWKFANKIVGKSDLDLQNIIKERDLKIIKLSDGIVNSGFFKGLLFKILRFCEKGNVETKIEAMEK